MRKLLLLLGFFLAMPLIASAQGFRMGSDGSPIASSLTGPGVVSTLQGTINICASPANGVPCTNKSQTYTSVTLATPCATSTQIVLSGTNTCVAQSDGRGNWGAWVPAGIYDYTVTISTGASFGPFTINVGIPSSSTISPALIICNNFDTIQCVDDVNSQGRVGANQGAWINQAAVSMGATGGTIYVLGAGGTWTTNIWSGVTGPVSIIAWGCPTFTVSAAQIPTVNGSKLLAVGGRPYCAVVALNNATTDFLDPTAAAFEFGNFTIKPAGGITRTAGWTVNPGAGALYGFYHDLLLSDTYNGFNFVVPSGTPPSSTTLANIQYSCDLGSSANAGTWLNIGGTTVGISGMEIDNFKTVGDNCKHVAASLIVDSGSDTINFNSLGIGPPAATSTAPNILIQNSAGGGVPPRWVNFAAHTSTEGASVAQSTAGADCVTITSGNVISFEDLYAVRCNRGVVLAPTAATAVNDVKIKGGIIGSSYVGGIVNTTQCSPCDLSINHVSFSFNAAQQASGAGTSSDITLFNGTTDVSILGNSFGSPAISNAAGSKYGIDFGGTSTDRLTVLGNTVFLTSLVTGFQHNLGGSTLTKAFIQNGYDSGTASLLLIGDLGLAEGLQMYSSRAGGGQWKFDEAGGIKKISVTSILSGTQAWEYDDTGKGFRLPSGILDITGIAAPSGLASNARCYEDSTANALECSYNNAGFSVVPLVGRANTWTAAQTLGSGGSLNATSLLVSPTAPTIAGAGCGGSAASISNSNGTAAFEVNVGTAPGSACTITMPAAAHKWVCTAVDFTTNSTTVFYQKQSPVASQTTTQIVITNFSDVAAASAFTASDLMGVSCHAY